MYINYNMKFDYKPKWGGLRKIADAPAPCQHPEHNPPGLVVLSPGMYEHTCPGCGDTITFTVSGTYC